MTENERLLELLVEGREIVAFYENEVTNLQGALSLLLRNYSGSEHLDAISVDVANVLGKSLERVGNFNEEDH